MGDIIIKAENLGKSYIIGHQKQERYTALRDVLVNKAKRFGGKTKQIFKSGHIIPGNETEEFWALKDINLEIKQGDRVGIIGRNGAGKSTLLKVLSRITEPTTGRITMRGRVASLLEVGTGFHPELTGRENIFLNGAILGMSRIEIKKKFDEIVDFSGVEKFLDTPVKRYSSGMYVRLAFSVAAHLEPDILVVDEVLAVGDAEFQKKCLGKMEDVSANEGRTVLFVSHNMAAIKSLCTSAIILHNGEKLLHDSVFKSIKKYLSFDQKEQNKNARYKREEIPTGKQMYINEINLIDDQSLDYFCLQLELKIYSLIETKIGINIKLKDGLGFPVAAGFSHYFLPELINITVGENTVSMTTKKLNLAIGSYKLSFELVIPGFEMLDKQEDCLQFELNGDSVSQRFYGISQSLGFGATEIKFKTIKQKL